MIRKWLVYFVLLFSYLSPCTAFAWDSVGHRLISAIAYTHLNEKVRQKIDLLTEALDPGYPAFSRFLYVSVLPDQWKKQGDGNSAQWHYINFPWSLDGTPTHPPKTANIINAFNEKLSLLQDTGLTQIQRANALAYVLHLSEDAHQPLHCISQFSHSFPNGDRGGNLFSIQTQYADNLHAYWDQSARLLIKSNQHYPLSNKQIRQLARSLQQEYPSSSFGKAIYDLSINQWVSECYKIAKTYVYNLTPEQKPPESYQYMAQKISAQQMLLSGYRLARLLNELLK